jgi:hypothetical protein
MRFALNGWQRLWVLVSVVLLGLVLYSAVGVAPVQDPLVIQDLQSPDCKAYRSKPDYFNEFTKPNFGEPCSYLRSYEVDKLTNFHSVRQYKDHIVERQIVVAVSALVLWLVLAGAVYLFGLLVAWVRRGFQSQHA